MTRHRTLPLLVLVIASLPLLGDTCTEKKIVELVIGVPIKATFVAEGQENQYMDTAIVRKGDIDISGELEKANIDPSELDADELRVSRVFYKCKVADPQADRRITGKVEVVELDSNGQPIPPGTPALFVDGWTGDFGAVTEFIDVTDTLQPDGVDLLNGFLQDCLRDLQNPGSVPPRYGFECTVSGSSTPSEPTDFQWELLVQFQAIVPQEFDIPF